MEPLSPGPEALSASSSAGRSTAPQLGPSGLQRKCAQLTGHWTQHESTFASMEKLQAVTGHPWLLRHLTCSIWRKICVIVDQSSVTVRQKETQHRSCRHKLPFTSLIASTPSCPLGLCVHRSLSSRASPSERCGVATSAAHSCPQAAGPSGPRSHARRSTRNAERNGSRTGS